MAPAEPEAALPREPGPEPPSLLRGPPARGARWGAWPTVALGANLWLVALALPAAYAGAPDVAPLLLPMPVLLAVGVQRRSAATLLVAVPLAALLPWLVPELAAVRREAALGAATGAMLIGYLLASLRWLAQGARGALEEAARAAGWVTRAPLPGSDARRWRERRRLHRGLIAAAVAVPSLLLWLVAGRASVTAALAQRFADPDAALAVLTALASLLGILFVARVLVLPFVRALDPPERGGLA